MILLLHPRATQPRNRRFPLTMLTLAAVLEGREEYRIVDGNAEDLTAAEWGGPEPPELLAVSVMPGPQLVEAVRLTRAFRQRYARVPVVWGGYFPSLYADACLNAGYVDFVVRGQGEETLPELLAGIRGGGDLARVRGLSWRDRGLHVHNAPRPLRSPGDFPWPPYHRLDAAKYIRRTFLGSRTAVHQASIGCPFRCNFCGVVPVYDREKTETPERTAAILGYLQRQYRIDAVQFYDNNFFLREDHARELAGRLEPLHLRWWCEARVDIVLGYSDDTLRRLRRAGCTMIFFGVESGSDDVLRGMRKQIESGQVLALAARLRATGIVPEYSFIFGDPQDPEGRLRENIEFIRKVKHINPAVEIIVQTYVPTPQRDGTYGGVEVQFPDTPDEWAREPWYSFMVRRNPALPWLPEHVKHAIEDFETVMRARWPTVQDARLPRWGRLFLKSLSSWRYALGVYARPRELRWAENKLRLRQPRLESL